MDLIVQGEPPVFQRTLLTNGVNEFQYMVVSYNLSVFLEEFHKAQFGPVAVLLATKMMSLKFVV